MASHKRWYFLLCPNFDITVSMNDTNTNSVQVLFEICSLKFKYEQPSSISRWKLFDLKIWFCEHEYDLTFIFSTSPYLGLLTLSVTRALLIREGWLLLKTLKILALSRLGSPNPEGLCFQYSSSRICQNLEGNILTCVISVLNSNGNNVWGLNWHLCVMFV